LCKFLRCWRCHLRGGTSLRRAGWLEARGVGRVPRTTRCDPGRHAQCIRRPRRAAHCPRPSLYRRHGRSPQPRPVIWPPTRPQEDGALGRQAHGPARCVLVFVCQACQRGSDRRAGGGLRRLDSTALPRLAALWRNRPATAGSMSAPEAKCASSTCLRDVEGPFTNVGKVPRYGRLVRSSRKGGSHQICHGCKIRADAAPVARPLETPRTHPETGI
jgi:hypothetical protein